MEQKTNKKDMSFLGHVGALRKHILRVLLAIAAAAILVGYNIRFVMDTIIFGPVKNEFISFRIINAASNYFGKGSVIVMPDKFPILVRRVFEQLDTTFSVSFTGGLIIAFPYVLYEIWRFLAPALKKNEKKNSIGFLASTYFLFILGCCFGYFLVTPLTMHFGYFFNISGMINMNIDLSSYISILLKTVLGMGFVFLLPIITYTLSSIGLLAPSFLKTYRRHALIVILVIAGFITPGDILSMIVASIPLYMLYEASILVSAMAYKKYNSSEENKSDKTNKTEKENI